MSLTCTRRLQFCAGHRVMGHENKCAHMHGHNYVVYITAEAAGSNREVDTIGRVVDFSVLKKVYNTWIQEQFDHGFILHQDDSYAQYALTLFSEKSGVNQKVYTMLDNPTAENLASLLLTYDHFVQALAPYHVRVVKVVVQETENCQAEASL